MEKIYNRQIKFQEQMSTNYEIQYLALLGEFGEFIDSLGFADWKEDIRDEENMLVEAMDICIFAMNCNHYLRKPFIRQDAPTWASYSDFQLSVEIVDLISKEKFLEIVALIFFVYPEVKKKIIGKQALNLFRQDNGYKEGTYTKIWNGVEDNVYMLKASQKDDSFEAIYEALSYEYSCLQ